jgi:hypothetical protein
MPAGLGPLGFAYFAGAKFLGYSVYSTWINHRLEKHNPADELPSAWKGGAVRTGIGVAVGAVAGLGFWALVRPNTFLEKYGGWVFFGGLVPVRVAEWAFFLWLLYRKFRVGGIDKELFIAFGVGTSFVLDAIGIFTAMVAPGGVSIC